MRLDQLILKNYRCFVETSIDFHPKLTVLIAPNGAGKTTILDAVAVAFGPYVGAFDESVGRHFEPSDIRLTRVRQTATNEMEYAPKGVSLKATGVISGESAEHGEHPALDVWSRNLAGPTKAKTTTKDAKALINYGKRQQEAVRTPGAETTLPLLAYYGTGRLWQQKKLTVGKLPRTSRTIGYTDCLDSGSSYKSFAAWFGYWSTNAFKDQLEASKAGRHYEPTEFDHFLDSVGGAVNACLAPAGWKDIAYSFSRQELVAHHDRDGELPIELLSDGVRNMIGMVADIAFRATKLNPQFGALAAKQTPGVVLIDEVDMHLHPGWQQVVLQDLTAAFPKLQFIVTTHSPQVLSTVRRENIRIIGPDTNSNIIAAQPLAMTYGEPSGDVLHSVMMVDPQPPVQEKADLQRLTALVDQGEYESPQAIQLRQALLAALGEQHPQLQRLGRSMARQKMLRKISNS